MKEQESPNRPVRGFIYFNISWLGGVLFWGNVLPVSKLYQANTQKQRVRERKLYTVAVPGLTTLKG